MFLPNDIFKRISHEFGESDRSCRYFYLHFFNYIFLRGRQVGHAGWVGYNSVRTHSGSGNRDATHCAQGRVLSQLALASSQHGRSTAGHRPSSSRQRQKEIEFGILEDDRCIDTGIFQRRYLVHELVFACSPPPPPRFQISHTILT